ncbi:glutamine amidotransferase-related protein [Acetobacter conturbans]|nr:gamma-glutamyl-gamma-aminobutyrate hydrolase family protein [Acetobacter conturbans]
MTLLIVEADNINDAYLSASCAAYALGMPSHFAVSATVEEHLGSEGREFPTNDGHLINAGYFWIDRICGAGKAGRPLSDGEIIDLATQEDCLIAPAPHGMSAWCRNLEYQAKEKDIEVSHAVSIKRGSEVFLRFDDGSEYYSGFIDRNGRFNPETAPSDRIGLPVLRIGIVGTVEHHSYVNVAALTSLSDAAEQAAYDLDIRFISESEADLSGVLSEVYGILLPGGDAINAPLQIKIAGEARRLGKPVVGLCLGMQSMVTAFARSCEGLADATLAELNSDSNCISFEPVYSSDGVQIHTIGPAGFHFIKDTKLSGLFDPHPEVRVNHRYSLSGNMRPVLEKSGLFISAVRNDDGIVEVIELPQGSFFCGMQGHPEFSSKPGNPHPLLQSFLAEAAFCSSVN